MLFFGFIWLYNVLTCSALIHENVFFHEVGTFSMTRSKWTITFVMDLTTYGRFLEKLETDIDKTEYFCNQLITSLMTPASNTVPTTHYKAIIGGLKGQISIIKGMHNEIKDSFNDYRFLGQTGKKRQERKVLGFIGGFMSDLFGVVTEDELFTVARNVQRLLSNQQVVTHVVEEAISVINVSKKGIIENRQKINDLITVVGDIEDEITRLSTGIQKQIRDIQFAQLVFGKLDSLIEDIKNALIRSMYFYTHFQLQMQSIIMKKMSPTTISADMLRDILLEIQEKLPKTVGLPRNPRTNLFDYYKLLSCVPMFDGRQIIISVQIPLVEYSQQFDIYRAYSLPVPLLSKVLKGSNPNLLVYYKLEADFLAVNSERTKYILMNENDVQSCINSGMQICNVKKPVMNTNIGQSCIMSNFNQNKLLAKQTCQTRVRQTYLPTAFYLVNDAYLIITDQSIVFHVSCKNEAKGRLIIEPPFGFVALHKTCQATSSYFSLMGYYENATHKEINNPLNGMLNVYNISDLQVWDNISLVMPFKNRTFKSLSKLADLEDFPLKQLIDELGKEKDIVSKTSEHFPVWGYMVVFSTILILVLISIIILRFCLLQKKSRVPESCALKSLQYSADIETAPENNDEQIVSLTETSTSTDIIKQKFNTLDLKK